MGEVYDEVGGLGLCECRNVCGIGDNLFRLTT